MRVDTLNLILLILIIIMLFAYLFIRVFFSSKYLAHQVPIVNSANDVISNLDLSRVVQRYRIIFELQDYEIKFQETDSLYTLDKGVNKSKKTIIFSKVIFPSVGYELDYLLGTLWFISQKVIKKNRNVQIYSFINRFGFNLNFFFLFVFALLSVAMYLLVWVTFHGDVNNEGILFLWNVPIFQILAFLVFLNSFVLYIVLLKIKPTLEKEYGQQLALTFDQNFKEFSFDLNAARNYATQVPLPHNFTFKTISNSKFKWLGPFVKQ